SFMPPWWNLVDTADSKSAAARFMGSSPIGGTNVGELTTPGIMEAGMTVGYYDSWLWGFKSRSHKPRTRRMGETGTNTSTQAPLAQLVEQRALNSRVLGSSPRGRTDIKHGFVTQ